MSDHYADWSDEMVDGADGGAMLPEMVREQLIQAVGERAFLTDPSIYYLVNEYVDLYRLLLETEDQLPDEVTPKRVEEQQKEAVAMCRLQSAIGKGEGDE